MSCSDEVNGNSVEELRLEMDEQREGQSKDVVDEFELNLLRIDKVSVRV